MKITINELNGQEFQKLVEYMNRTENTYQHNTSKPSALPKSKIMSIGETESRSVYSQEHGYTVLPIYRGIEIEVAEREMTSEELTGLMKLVYKFKSGVSQ